MYKELVKRILRGEKARGAIDVSLVDDSVIRGLNRRFRKKDKPTDVLAFPYLPDRQAGGKAAKRNEIIGDVIISPAVARRNARRYGNGYRAELKRLVIHGVLHVLGYDHGKEMRHAEKIYSQH